jgi:sensor c-di-GMP phosphodiesterase-like protein
MKTSEQVFDALNNSELFIEYLPTISLADGKCVGAEACNILQR